MFEKSKSTGNYIFTVVSLYKKDLIAILMLIIAYFLIVYSLLIIWILKGLLGKNTFTSKLVFISVNFSPGAIKYTSNPVIILTE